VLTEAAPNSAAGAVQAQAGKSRDARVIVAPNKTYRSMEWEFHTPPEEGFNVNLRAAMSAARDSGAQALMLHAQDHWGYAFYTSDVGVRHPRLTGDFFGDEVRLARKHGMSAICYYSLQYNNQVVFHHPDWAWVDEQGVQQRRRLRWFLPCLSGWLPKRWSDVKFPAWTPVVFRRRSPNFSGYSPMTRPAQDTLSTGGGRTGLRA